MTIKEYQQTVWDTYMGKKTLSRDEQLVNNAFGLIGETGEVVDQIKKDKYLCRGLSDLDHMEEIGDVMWHLTCIASIYGLDMESIMEYNIQKLKARYPDAGKQV